MEKHQAVLIVDSTMEARYMVTFEVAKEVFWALKKKKVVSLVVLSMILYGGNSEVVA